MLSYVVYYKGDIFKVQLDLGKNIVCIKATGPAVYTHKWTLCQNNSFIAL